MLHLWWRLRCQGHTSLHAVHSLSHLRRIRGGHARNGYAHRVAPNVSRKLPLIAHADWSIHPRKRWVSIAKPSGAGYVVTSPRLLGDIDGFLKWLTSQAERWPVLAGFDFPIGLPTAYAKKARVASFREFLKECATGERSSFFDIAETKRDIRLDRPFYPRGVRGCQQEHLTQALRLGWLDLFRLCEKGTARRRSACPLFWTLGGNQVGRAALHGWRWVLLPSLVQGDVAIWPFDGTMTALLSRPSIKAVVVETYPAEGLCQLLEGPPPQGSKRDREYRRHIGKALLARAQNLSPSPALRREVLDGYGHSADGEDRFDATIGAMALAKWALADFPQEPSGDSIRRVEGWIANQPLL